jgi:hypothetical protein
MNTISSSGATLKPAGRYRLPGIEREGIAQLSLLETALWPLQGGALPALQFETSFGYTTEQGRQAAQVTVRSPLGLQPLDEYVLWGLLGLSLSRQDAEPVLMATPSWMLRQLGLATGGSQYAALRDSLLRLAVTSYQNTGFYNPQTQQREFAAFQFLSMLLPTVGGRGITVDNERLWRIEWNPAFYRFCQATGGSLLFDLDLYQTLTPAARRLFLKLKDRFWRSKRVFFNVDDLTINGLGFAASRPLYKRKFDLTGCICELLEQRVIELGRGQTDPKELFQKRGKGSYVVVFYEGEYFRQPLAGRATSQKNALQDDPLYEPLRKIGVHEPAIRRLFREQSRGAIQRWVKITDAALHDKPRGFAGFKVSAAAFLMDGIQNNRLPPDWMYAHEKRQQQEQWERERQDATAQEQALRAVYQQQRAEALEAFLRSEAGRQTYDEAYRALVVLYQAKEPDRYQAAAREAALERVERFDFLFPEFATWAMQTKGSTEETAA